MSNCIDLRNATHRLTDSQIDVAGLRALIESVKDVDGPRSLDGEGMGNERMAWWFLTQADFSEPGAVTIEFGRGRSTHTWRDFAGTMETIGKFAKKEFALRFTVRDTDAPSSWGSAVWIVKPSGGNWMWEELKGIGGAPWRE